MNDERLQSLDKLYRDHAAALIRIAGAVTRDTEASQDIVQEAFVRAYTGWHKLEDGAEDARHWLVRVVVNLAIDHVRRGRVLHRQGGVLWRLGREVEWTSGDLSTSLGERDRVATALGRLRPQERAALVLRHYLGYDYASIATIVGTTSGTVGSLINRGHSRIRRDLSADVSAQDGLSIPSRR